MSLSAETPKHTQLYGKLSAEQQEDLGKAVVEKLRSLIGGYGELSVLAEYIAVMLQSSRQADQIQTELEAFLQEQSQPFTRWLCAQIEAFAEGPPADAGGGGSADGGEALLNRAVRDAHAAQGKTSKKRAKGEPREASQRDVATRDAAEVSTRARRSSRNQEKASRAAAAGAATASAAAAAATAPAAGTSRKHRGEEHRSRSRNRRRRKTGEETPQLQADAASSRRSGGSAVNENSRDRSKVILTPNVQFLRDSYHQKGDEPPEEGPPSPSKWHFRAEPLATLTAPPQASVPAARPPPPEYAGVAPHYMSPYGAPYGAPPQRPAAPASGDATAQHEVASSTRAPLKTIAPRKWKVAHQGTVVRETEQLNSKEVRTLNEGEIVEQVAPALTLQGGIIRVCIRHPSSPQFPSPIGWVTQDASKAGGPTFLVPGPEPMSRGKPWRPVNGATAAGATDPYSPQPFRGHSAGPPGSPFSGQPPPPRAPAAPAGPRGPRGTFSNLVWTPGGD